MNDKLREPCVEDAVGVRQPFRRSAANVDAGVSRTRSHDEGFGRIDRRDRPGPKPRDQLGRESARTAANIQRAIADVMRARSTSCGASCRECTPMKRS